ncbi:MAG: hypothetical protein AMXMBFR52_14000 [Burkholderiales bacterium]
MNPESPLNAPLPGRDDRSALQVPTRSRVDARGAPSHGASRGRPDEPPPSFGDTIARARRDAEQQAGTRVNECAADPRARTAGHSAARSPADQRKTVAHDEAANRQAAQREPAAQRADVAAATPDREPAADAAAVPLPDAAVVAAAPVAVAPAVAAVVAAVAAAPGAAAPVAAASPASAPVADDKATVPAHPAMPLTTVDRVAQTVAGQPPQALTASGEATSAPCAPGAAQAVDTPGAERRPATPSGTITTVRDAITALAPADTGELARAASRPAPGSSPNAAAGPPEALAPVSDAAGSDAIDSTVAADPLARDAAALSRPAPGEAVGRASPSGGTPSAAAAVGGSSPLPAAPAVAHPPGTHPPATGSIATPLAHPAFANHFATEVASLALRGIERAEIVLNPRELGPVRIELSLNGEAARVAFSAVQPQTRHAIEQTLPLLESMLAEHGLMLSGSSVSDGSAHRESGAGTGTDRHATGVIGTRESAFEASQIRLSTAVTPVRTTSGLLDLYA